MRKSTVVIINQLNIKNNKIDKDNFEKKHKKIMWGKHCSNPQYLKKTTKLNSQPVQSEKKIYKDNSGKKTKKNHKKRKKPCGGNTIAIHNVLKKKTTKLNFQPSQY